MIAIDTNIWVYLHDTRDPLRQGIAQGVIASAKPLAVPWQVGCEFIHASRKLLSIGFTEDMAWSALGDILAQADAILLPVPDLWPDTHSLRQRYTLSYWDALLAAACLHEGVTTLYSEDAGFPPVIDGMTVVNPFAIP